MKFLKPKTVTDPRVIEEFLTRGMENVFPSKEALAKVLSSGKQISIYLGVDPTGPTLHMGHAIPLMKLGELQKMGHRIILLMGDFTAMIGDPDKLSVRKPLTRKEVLANLKNYKKQASRFLAFSGPNAAKFLYNSSWLAKMDLEKVIDLASHMTVDQMLKRDMFRKRSEEGRPIFVHEFLYPLMQGYDSVAMDVDAEIGGNDQTFNMLAGRDLMKALKDKEKFVLATKLLVDPTGKKMGKTEGNMITLEDSAEDIFGKVMSWPDSLIINGYELCTQVPAAAIEKEREFLAGKGNPRDAKMRLALALVEFYRGAAAAKKAKDSFTQAFSQGGMPADAPTVSVERGAHLGAILVAEKLVSSKSEFGRLAAGGGVRDLKTDAKITAHDFKIAADMDVRVGSHKFLKIRVK